MKLYTDVVYNLRMCTKSDNCGMPKKYQGREFKGDNYLCETEVILCVWLTIFTSFSVNCFKYLFFRQHIFGQFLYLVFLTVIKNTVMILSENLRVVTLLQLDELKE